jgi:hypothetical protein
VLNTIAPDEDGTIVLTGGQFGWEFCTFDCAIVKANYAAIHAISENDSDKIDMLIEVIKEHTGAKEVVLQIYTNYEDAKEHIQWSYIDHQSLSVCHDAFESKNSLSDFIFNPNSYLYTGNDNDND